MRVLVADDKETWHKLFETVLSLRGMEVLHAKTPKETISLAASGRPDVVLLDYSLVGGTAYDAIPSLRELEIPVIVMGYRAEGFEPEKARKLGATEVLEKPFTVEELISLISKVVSGEALLQPQPQPQVEETFAIEEPSSAEEIQIIDLEETPVETIELEAPIEELPISHQVEEKVEELELQPVEEFKEKTIKEEVVEKVSKPVSEELTKAELSLPPEKVEEIIREIAWEVIPEVAEKVIREEIEKLIKSRLA